LERCRLHQKRIAIDKTKVGDIKTESSVRYVDIIPGLENKLKELYEITGQYEYIYLLLILINLFILMTY
tara:strand:- start:4278 stop:4484 length:207 start_codon:yes stop_codon:yes gene_type:complete